MNFNKKTNIALLILAAAIVFLIFFAISSLFGQIKKESENFIAQREKLAESEAKIKNIHNFRNNFRRYQPNLEKIDSLFVDITEPVEFIEFLEKEAAASRLSISITPSAALEFSLSMEGPFSNFSRFLERLEYGPYLLSPVNLSVRKVLNKDDVISATLLIKTPAR